MFFPFFFISSPPSVSPVPCFSLSCLSSCPHLCTSTCGPQTSLCPSHQQVWSPHRSCCWLQQCWAGTEVRVSRALWEDWSCLLLVTVAWYGLSFSCMVRDWLVQEWSTNWKYNAPDTIFFLSFLLKKRSCKLFISYLFLCMLSISNICFRNGGIRCSSSAIFTDLPLQSLCSLLLFLLGPSSVSDPVRGRRSFLHLPISVPAEGTGLK